MFIWSLRVLPGPEIALPYVGSVLLFVRHRREDSPGRGTSKVIIGSSGRDLTHPAGPVRAPSWNQAPHKHVRHRFWNLIPELRSNWTLGGTWLNCERVFSPLSSERTSPHMSYHSQTPGRIQKVNPQFWSLILLWCR